jgi:hypothetical protein
MKIWGSGDIGEWSPSHSSRFTLGKSSLCAHWIEGWEGSRAALDAMEKREILPQPEIELQPSNP